MYQRVVKVGRIVDEPKIENKEKGRAKREIGPGESNSQEAETLEGLNMR